MSFLADLLMSIGESAFAPSSDRGMVAAWSAGSIGLATAIVWLLATSDNPLNQPAWGFGLLVAAIVWGGGGLLVSLLHLVRNESDRLVGALGLMANAAAVTMGFAWMIVR